MNPGLIQLLRSTGPQPAGALAERMAISRPTLSRLVRAAGDDLVSLGNARRTAYAARRPLRGATAPLPLFRIGLDGMPAEIGQLALIHPYGCAVEFRAPFGWPMDDTMSNGWFEGLPYPLQDMRPQGFLGRNFARRHAAVLQVGEDPSTWSDDDALYALAVLGADTPGDLLVGEAACRLWLAHVQSVKAGTAEPGVTDEQQAARYPAYAQQALSLGIAGSSAGGEFPKFTALRRRPDGSDQHVLVKFSGSDDSPGTQRWSDLLVCEHLAGRVVQAELGVAAATSRIAQAGGRTFLEVDRFDRHGALGRSALVSWLSVNSALVGQVGRPWADTVSALLPQRWVTRQAIEVIRTVWMFGQLIGNTDMHDGNLSFVPAGGARANGLALAPTYDMLPMGYAPVRGVELTPWTFTPRLPLPAETAAWNQAARAAVVFWQTAAADARISGEFQRICAANAQSLAQWLA
ncbi:HipA-like C-terminal domain-containing protein [Roseateles sp. YR242]|uniref:type II toxin-antitoxin system HipA family toxin YjjJ n=1 Tax=Roseateles sp. YR242 TaxID=1855305 RepID=UPI0008ABC0A9|nr:type II toxin-antitoxin system HipA family toxin YjjJ [Roseateles sp. YR242]SEK80765.1 HipA-like C-terminal domain-containing protein [Roseateles sp. YR242]